MSLQAKVEPQLPSWSGTTYPLTGYVWTSAEGSQHACLSMASGLVNVSVHVPVAALEQLRDALNALLIEADDHRRQALADAAVTEAA